MTREEQLPIDTQVMLKNVEFGGYDEPILDGNTTEDLTKVKVITSIVRDSPEKHKLIIDVDFPVYAVPSSTPGHSHLYIDKEISHNDLVGVLYAMADAGIVETGYASACEDQGMSVVRAPWEKKEGVK